MKRVFSFGSGNLYTWMGPVKEYNREYYNSLIGWCRMLDVDGVEIFFTHNESVSKFFLSQELGDWLRKLEYVSIHAPPALPENEGDMLEVLEKISRIYGRYNSKNLIIHPTCIPERRILDRFGMSVSTENLSPKRGIGIKELKRIADVSGAGLCLDVAHAFFWSKHETARLMKAFDWRITQIHFSAAAPGKMHVSLTEACKDFIFSAKPLLDTDVPVVIEQKMEKKSISLANREIRKIKRFFSRKKQ